MVCLEIVLSRESISWVILAKTCHLAETRMRLGLTVDLGQIRRRRQQARAQHWYCIKWKP